ncbi:MAG: hypothetical protein ACYC35_21355 [Pirellulales bacterium]
MSLKVRYVRLAISAAEHRHVRLAAAHRDQSTVAFVRQATLDTAAHVLGSSVGDSFLLAPLKAAESLDHVPEGAE